MAGTVKKTPAEFKLPVESGGEGKGDGGNEQDGLFLVQLQHDMESSLKGEAKKKTTVADYLRLLAYLEQNKGGKSQVKEIVVRWQEPQVTDGLNT